MKQDLKQYAFDKVLMTAVFVGIIITVIAIFFDAIFLESTGFPYSEIINVSSLIFGVNLIFLAVGPIYYWFTRLSRYGHIGFIVVFILLTLFLVLRIQGIDRTNDHLLNIEFRELLSALAIIVGTGICLGIPLLIRNNKFGKNVI